MSVSSQRLKRKSGAVPGAEGLILGLIELISLWKWSLIELNPGSVSDTKGAQRETPNKS